MAEFDLVVRGGTVVTASDAVRADVGVRGGRIAAVAERISDGARVIDAGGLLVMPGGVDTHCHIEQHESGQHGVGGGVSEESFATGSRSCFAGGTTTVVTFANQHKGHAIAETLDDYRARAKGGAAVDYSFHQIVTDPTDAVVREEIPALIASGIRSLKVFLTYDPLHLDDRQYLRVLAAARRHGALVTVHCENYEAIRLRTEALIAAGHTDPKYHAWSRPRVVEREATHRAIALAELVDTPIQIFHVSCADAAEEVARAQARGVRVWAETCPQYFVLSAADMDRPGFEGAKFMCSPAPRDAEESARLWGYVRRGVLDVVSSDHSGYTFARGKRVRGEAPFSVVPNGVPGLAARLPLMFHEGVTSGRLTPSEFVALVATNPARLFGLHPRKGTIAAGMDADLVLWDPAKRVTLTAGLMQSAIDYTPYEGRAVVGWPVATIRRGEVVMEDGRVAAEPGSGQFLVRAPYPMIAPRGALADGFDMAAFAG